MKTHYLIALIVMMALSQDTLRAGNDDDVLRHHKEDISMEQPNMFCYIAQKGYMCRKRQGADPPAPAKGLSGAKFSALGDVRDFDISDITPEELGNVRKPIKKLLTLPQGKGTMLVVTYIPSQGPLQGKTIHTLFNNVKHLPGTPEAKNTDIAVYATLDPQGVNAWTEVALRTFENTAMSAQDATITLEIQPDGTAALLPDKGEPIMFQMMQYLTPGS